MTNELEFADVFLRHAHPENEGWILFRNCKVGEHQLQRVFHKEGAYTLVVLRMEGPVVSKTHITMAECVQNVCVAKFKNKQVRVFMVYGKLLGRVATLPKGVSVMTVVEESDSNPENDLYDVYLN